MRARRGFTLVELLVALAIGASVLLGSRMLLEGLATHAAAIGREAAAADADANAERTMRQVIGNVAIAPDLQPSFTGTSTEAAFQSWCPSARGGLVACRVRLFIRDASGQRQAVLSPSVGDEVALPRAGSAALRYLADAAGGGRWASRWDDALTPPVAIGIAGSDTLLFRIGERR